MNPQRFLVLGATGVVGRHLCRRLGPDQAVATYHSRSLPGATRFDATTMRLADTILPLYPGLTHAFVLLGVTAIDACGRDPAGTSRVNVDGVLRVIDDLSGAGITPLFTSTDAVFDGSRGGWTETDLPCPILTYGKQKVEVEKHLAKLSSPWLDVRLSKVVDPEAPAQDWLGDWLRKLEQGEEIRAARDQVFSPVEASEAADALVQLAETNATGLFHLAGPEPCSRLELLEQLTAAARPHLGATVPRIVPCSIRDFPFVEPRPLDTSLSSAKLSRTLKRTFSGVKAVCQRVVRSRYGL